jgi:hypothetical protein
MEHGGRVMFGLVKRKRYGAALLGAIGAAATLIALRGLSWLTALPGALVVGAAVAWIGLQTVGEAQGWEHRKRPRRGTTPSVAPRRTSF